MHPNAGKMCTYFDTPFKFASCTQGHALQEPKYEYCENGRTVIGHDNDLTQAKGKEPIMFGSTTRKAQCHSAPKPFQVERRCLVNLWTRKRAKPGTDTEMVVSRTGRVETKLFTEVRRLV
jgi:hypothetical protein